MSLPRLRRDLLLTDEQWDLLTNTFPNDPVIQAEMCLDALSYVGIPNPYGKTQTGIRVYKDNGFMGSGYTMVHWDDAKSLPWCLDNGYTPNGFPESELPLIWDEDPKREKALEIHKLLRERAYITDQEIDENDKFLAELDRRNQS